MGLYITYINIRYDNIRRQEARKDEEVSLKQTIENSRKAQREDTDISQGFEETDRKRTEITTGTE